MQFLRRSIIISCCLAPVVSLAATSAYTDIPPVTWYRDAVTAMAHSGYLDASKPLFRPTDNATRAEFIKLVVMLNGGIINTSPAIGSFDDVSKSDWFFPYFEEAAKEHWVRGQGDCIGRSRCFAHPNDPITRAEAAVLIMRTFQLGASGDQRTFIDVAAGQWYTDAFTALADMCVLNGDATTGRMRPFSSMNRAEMIVMLHRTDQHLAYGTVCDRLPESSPAIRNALMISTSTVEVEFTKDIDPSAMLDISHYSIAGERGSMTFLSAQKINGNTVELKLQEQQECGMKYILSVKDMQTAADMLFSDSANFTGYCT